jgi:hypothetical protein
MIEEITGPGNNTKAYDLWVDIAANGHVLRICNWSSLPLIIRQPAVSMFIC